MGVERPKERQPAFLGGSKPLRQKQKFQTSKKLRKMRNEFGQWFEQNQMKLNETSNNEKAQAVNDLRKYINKNLRGCTKYGAHSAAVLGCEPDDYYLQKAWQKIYDGIWAWKDGRTLADQLMRTASSLMQKQVEKFRNATKDGAQVRENDMWLRVDLDVERMSEAPKCVMTEDGRMLTEEEAELENAYEVMLEVLKDKPEQVEYVLEVKKGGTYDDIAEAMGIEVREVRLIERRVLRKLTAYRLKNGKN